MKHRKLRTAWSVGWGIAAVLLVALWVRSHWSWDAAWIYTPTAELLIDAQSGETFLRYHTPPVSPKSEVIGVKSVPALDIFVMPPGSYAGFRFIRSYGFGLFVPFWFLVIVATSLTVAPWITWKFSLRMLLIATTLVAVGLGLIVWLLND
jgi:hypothetical protein